MDLVQIKHLLKWLKKGHLEQLILEIFILASMINCIKNYGKNLMILKKMDQNYYCSNYYDVQVNKYKVKYGTLRLRSSRFWENKVGLIL